MSDDFRVLPDLAVRTVGGTVVWANDEFFAGSENLITAAPSSHDATTYAPRGKVYDGWETRRRREPGHDSVILRLGMPGLVHGVVVDTSHFTGNFPPYAWVETATLLGYPSVDDLLQADWQPVVPRSPLKGDAPNLLPADAPDRLATHVRLGIDPDGGVARLRVHGEVVADPRVLGGRIDLAATAHGGRITGCSNMFYASPANVLAPGRAVVMSDGWETARRRDDGNDWLSVELAAAGVLHDAVIDTTRFVGNAPGWARLSDADTGEDLLARTALLPDTEHRFRIRTMSAVRHVRLDIYPDGGISRLRLNGEIAPSARDGLAQRWLNLLPPGLADSVDRGEFFD